MSDKGFEHGNKTVQLWIHEFSVLLVWIIRPFKLLLKLLWLRILSVYFLFSNHLRKPFLECPGLPQWYQLPFLTQLRFSTNLRIHCSFFEWTWQIEGYFLFGMESLFLPFRLWRLILLLISRRTSSSSLSMVMYTWALKMVDVTNNDSGNGFISIDFLWALSIATFCVDNWTIKEWNLLRWWS